MKPLAPLHWPYLGVHVHSISPEQKRGKGRKWLKYVAGKMVGPLMVSFMTICGLALAVSVGRYFAS